MLNIFNGKQKCTSAKQTIQIHHKVTHQQKWSDFMNTFTNTYWTFVFRQCSSVNQHSTRKLLTTLDSSNTPLLTDNFLFCSIDYISNLSVK